MSPSARSAEAVARVIKAYDVRGLVGVELDEAFVADLDAVLSSLVYGLLGRFAAGEIAITDIVATLDRSIRWMTRGYDAESATSNSTCSSVSPRRRNVGS